MTSPTSFFTVEGVIALFPKNPCPSPGLAPSRPHIVRVTVCRHNSPVERLLSLLLWRLSEPEAAPELGPSAPPDAPCEPWAGPDGVAALGVLPPAGAAWLGPWHGPLPSSPSLSLEASPSFSAGLLCFAAACKPARHP